jgi:phosphoglycerol transferase MdoB-like AlkP superfamily enzyme
MNFEILLTILMGIGLSAASGFRVFIPLLVVSIASFTGNLALADSFSWIGTLPALITFGIATVFEIAGYYIPWVDNILDTITSPMAVVAGAVLMASVVTDISPLFKWTLAIIAGGGIAGTIQALTGVTRVTSSLTTGGLGNPAVSTVESGSSITLSVIAIFIPVIAAIVVIALLVWATKTLINRFTAKSKTSS